MKVNGREKELLKKNFSVVFLQASAIVRIVVICFFQISVAQFHDVSNVKS